MKSASSSERDRVDDRVEVEVLERREQDPARDHGRAPMIRTARKTMLRTFVFFLGTSSSAS